MWFQRTLPDLPNKGRAFVSLINSLDDCTVRTVADGVTFEVPPKSVSRVFICFFLYF